MRLRRGYSPPPRCRRASSGPFRIGLRSTPNAAVQGSPWRCCGEEYKAEHPQGLQYGQFRERYRVWRGRIDVVMRQTHRAGEKLFVDYAGQCVAVVDRITGELRNAQIFVAVLGASNVSGASGPP